MSASVELLREVSKSGLKVCEVPISCKYSNTVGEKTSTKNPLVHGVGLLMSLIKLVVEDRPLPIPWIAWHSVYCYRHTVWRLDDGSLCQIRSNNHEYCSGINSIYFDRLLHGFNSYNTIRNNTIINKNQYQKD